MLQVTVNPNQLVPAVGNEVSMPGVFFPSFWCDLVCIELCRNQKKKSLTGLPAITYTVRGFTKKKSGKQAEKAKKTVSF